MQLNIRNYSCYILITGIERYIWSTLSQKGMVYIVAILRLSANVFLHILQDDYTLLTPMLYVETIETAQLGKDFTASTIYWKITIVSYR